MRFSRLQKYIFSFITVFLLLFCRRDEQTAWDVKILAPLAKTSLTLHNLIADSLHRTNADGTISLVYHSRLAEATIDSSLALPDTSNQANIKLNTLTLDPVTVSNTITLSQLVAMVPDSDLLQWAIEMGLSVPIPPFGPIVQDSIPFDFGSYFQTMTVSDATVDITVHNHFPFPFTNVEFSIRNQGNDSLIFQQTIPVIPANDSVLISAHTGHKTIESRLYASTSISSPGTSTPVQLNPSWYISSTVSIHDVKIESAIAKFPPQMVIYNADENAYDLEGIQFHHIIFQKGKIRIEVYNTLPSPLHYIYTIPSATVHGIPFRVEGVVPAASGGHAYHSTNECDMTGYDLDLRGIGPIERMQNKDLNNNGYFDPDTINTFYNEVSADITQTTPLIPLSLNDSIYIRGEFLGMVPLYGEGFLGKDTLVIHETATFSNFLSGISVEHFELDSVNLLLVINNYIGAEGAVKIDQLTAWNTRTGQSATLAGYPAGAMININKPAKPFSPNDSVIPAQTMVEIKTGLCNIEKLLEIIPDKFECRFTVFINSGVAPPPPGKGTDFIYYGKGIRVEMAASVPLSFLARKLQLCDTVPVDVEQLDISSVSGQRFHVIAENKFPLTASVQLYIADSTGTICDSLITGAGKINAGIPDEMSERVLQPVKSIIPIDLTEDKIEKMRKKRHLIIKAVFDTSPVDKKIKIFDGDNLSVILSGNFNYRIH